MSWKRLATVALGVACFGVGTLVPASAPALYTAGAGLVGLGMRAKFLDGPGQPKEKRENKRD